MSDEFKVGDFTVRPQTSTVSSKRASQRVEPKVMDLLVYLAQNAGELVRKEDILCDVWTDDFVTQEVLSNVVWKLRRTLKDDSKKPRYVETIHKKGYRLVAPVKFSEEPRISSAALTVGHESERKQLQICYEEMLSGRGLLVCVSGEAGIGKTTLVENFLQLHSNDCYAARGKCSEHLAGTGGYLPTIEALEDLTRSSPRSRLGRLLKRTAPSWYAQVFPHGPDSAAALAQTQNYSFELMKRELVEFFLRVSDTRPLLLFYDDIHWADASGLDLGIYLSDHCRTARILLLTAYRPEFLQSDHPFVHFMLSLRARGLCRDLSVRPLKREEIASYIDQSFPGNRFPPEFAREIDLRTEGNPLFMVALLAHLRQRQLIIYDEGHSCWAIRQLPSGIERTIPDSIKGLIELKITRMGEQYERVLSCAAVQGPEFSSPVVARAMGAEPSDVEDSLQKLDRVHGFVKPVDLPASSRPRTLGNYRFVHVLYRDCLCEALASRRKASLSAAVAGALKEIHGNDWTRLALQIAVLEEAAGDFSNAAKSFLCAAERAKALWAYPEAAALAERGLALIDGVVDPKEQAGVGLALQSLIALSLTQMRGYAGPGVKEAYDRVYEMCLQSGSEIQASRYLLSIASCWLARANLSETLQATQKYREFPESQRNDILETWFYLLFCTAVSHSGELVHALEYGRQCALIDERLDREKVISFGDFDAGIVGHIQMARVLWLCGYPDQARASAERALSACRAMRHPATSAFAHFLASWFYYYLNDSRRSLECAEEALKTSVQYGFRMQEGWATALRGWAIANTGKPREGIQALDLGIRILEEIGWRLGLTELLGLKALACGRLGDADTSKAAFNRSLALMKETGEVYFEPELYHIRARILLRDASPSKRAKAESWLKRAIDAARRQSSRSFELRAATTLAEYCRKRGRKRQSYLELAPVYGWFTEGFDTPDLRRAAKTLESCR